jgi:DNA-binding NarL/FixJ family response regulator
VPRRFKNDVSELTVSEQEILKLIAEGYGREDVAEDLQMSITDVECSVSDVMKKLNCSDIHAAIESALKQGVITVYEVLESRFLKLGLQRGFGSENSMNRVGA